MLGIIIDIYPLYWTNRKEGIFCVKKIKTM